ncbi:FIMAH domain-containing protein [Neobacillus dielmonensis]|uniref:FIMAH domain-containing protein n=1 Tax=Neobacillus dielmonensis TaxID=1347369 RepID=UPI0005A7D124|nr:carbohydrate binding domain-containing protein [Neobacillus dielmonensis]
MKDKIKRFSICLLAAILTLSTLPFLQQPTSVAAADSWKELKVENGDFEAKPASATDLPSWVYWTGGLKTGMKISNEVVHSGNQSLAVDNTGVVGLFSQELKVTPGNEYKLSAQLYVKELTGKPGIWLRWYNDQGKNISDTPKYFDVPAFNTWQTVEIQATAPAGATGVKVFVYQPSTSKMKGYYDDIMLFEKDSNILDFPIKYGEPINHGPAALAAKSQGVAIGDDELYYATNGSPATFYATDAKTGKKIFSQDLPGSDVVWAMVIGADGNVYFAGTYNGILYRYVVKEKRLEQLGKNPSDNWVWQLEASRDGKIYGATYPNAKVFEYDIESAQFTDLGTFYEGQQYARGLGITDKSLFVGTGTTAYLMKMDLATRERTEIKLPITGQSTQISNIWEYGNNIFVAYGTSLVTIDKTTGEEKNTMDYQDENTFDGLISSPSPYDENIIYYINKNNQQLWTYDMTTHKQAKVEPTVQLPASPAKAMRWIKDESGKDVLAILHHQIEYSLFDPATNTVKVSYPEVDMQGLLMQSLEIGDDQKIYMGGYQGSFGVYDTSIDQYILHERDPHQIEGIGFLNGDVYLGTYGGARIFKYDPDLPFNYTDGGSGNNPEMVQDIGDDQSRPFTFTSGDNKLFVGTISDYGKLGGALTIYDAKTDKWNTIRNIIKDQSIIGLAYLDGTVFGGSTTAGGLGIDPTEPIAKMFEYDVKTGTHEVFDLHVKGLVKPEMIGELSVGPDGNLWGVAWGLDEKGAYNTVIFAMNPDTREILKSTELYKGVNRGSQWRPFFIRWDQQGYLYTTAGRQLTVIDPKTMKSKQLVTGNVQLMDLDKEGNIYYTADANLYQLPVLLKDGTLKVDSLSQLQGDEQSIDLSVHLVNGAEVDLAGAKIEWVNSNPAAASVEDGKIIGKNAGTTEIAAKVSYNGQQITTNTITVTIVVTTDTLAKQILALETAGSLPHSLAQQLTNALKQAEHQYQIRNTQQAWKHLDDFRKHLDNSSIDETVKTTLDNNVDYVEKAFTN